MTRPLSPLAFPPWTLMLIVRTVGAAGAGADPAAAPPGPELAAVLAPPPQPVSAATAIALAATKVAARFISYLPGYRLCKELIACHVTGVCIEWDAGAHLGGKVVRTNIDIDDELLAEAAQIAGTTTKKSTVEAALRELIRQHKVRRVLELWGSLEWEGDLHALRRSRFE